MKKLTDGEILSLHRKITTPSRRLLRFRLRIMASDREMNQGGAAWNALGRTILTLSGGLIFLVTALSLMLAIMVLTLLTAFCL